MVNIKVAVRIRPLSRRETFLGDDIIVRKDNNSVLVTDPKIPEKQDGDSRQRNRRFTVDFCFHPNDPKRCSQEAVYNEIGSEVLDSMFKGYNSCVLAYGHSASGKTYTIMGLDEDPGLTPRLCRGLFEKLDNRYFSERIRVQVTISFLEIYNEKVRDLLGSKETISTGSNFSLRVREHPKLGPYVQGLSEHLVTDKRKLLELLTTGNRRRSTAATESNIHSSRSHAVFTIHFKQCDGENFETEKSSKVHLVDLAGSLQEVSQQETQTDERANSSQSKERLKEGANINKSLVTLGHVVSALAESCESTTLLKAQYSSKNWHPFVPYRDSVLTWLLKDTLGGNSKTIMIATISPASSCLSETLNTLRYAKRTKRIVNQPIVNEDPKIRMIRQLRQEIARLKRLLLSHQSCGSWSKIRENDLEEAMVFSTPESKWLDPGGTKITNKEVYLSKNHKKQILLYKNVDKGEHGEEGESESENGLKDYEDEERKNFEDIGPSSENDCEESVLGQGAALLGGDACKLNDEKKSDVNGSVNDSFSHETQIFSDSLESFSSVFLKSEDASEGTFDGSGRLGTLKNATKTREASTEKFGPYLMRDFSSCEDLSKNMTSKMLRRSRPDLIKGISPTSKDGPPSGSSQSCTDISNLSQSTSENSLNSSGSVDIRSSDIRQSWDREAKNSILRKVRRERKEKGAKEEKGESASLLSAPKKTENRSEIVEAVTSRLYVTKKKPEIQGVFPKQKAEADRKLEELKLCKRARMKLFDLSRKLAMTRKIKKTVDNDTQTDSMTATLRVKEKCVTTDSRGALGSENFGTSVENFNKENPCLVMNQVFIPSASNYVLECGKMVRIEASEIASKHESATQTSHEDKSTKNVNTSPIKFNVCDEECFSEDSLDLEDKSRNCTLKTTEEQKKLNHEPKVSFFRPPGSEVYFSCDSEQPLTDNSTVKSKKSTERLFNLWPFIFFPKETTSRSEETSIHLSDACENSSDEWRKEENLSSENSFTSVDGTDMSCSSETSSEDFVFYESVKDQDSLLQGKPRRDRELYTITENSEQSDPSDAFSPAHKLISSFDSPEESKSECSRGRRQWGRVQRESKMRDQSVDAKGDKIRTKLIDPNPAPAESEIEKKNRAKDSDKVFKVLLQTSKCNTIKNENLKVPKPISLFTAETTPQSPDRVPRLAKDLEAENQTETIHSQPEGLRHRLRGTKTDPKPIYWTDFQSNSQKQYLNLSVPKCSTTTASAFSVDTNLFGEAPRKDQGTDAIYSSADSITFVFMGPAKPKTSVLMEIIRRSLGKTLSFPEESHLIQKKSRSRGVQCDVNLMRSVSVDSAMMALSKIAKNQESYTGLRRTASVRALSPSETVIAPSQKKLQGQIENYSLLGLEDEYSESEMKKSALKYSVAVSTNSVENIKNDRTEEPEKAKKSVSWSGETKHETELEWEESDFDINYRDSPKLGGEGSSEGISSKFFPQKRVRFLKRNTRQHSEIKLGRGPVDPLKAFLREATMLLKYINFCSSKNPEFSQKVTEEFSFAEKIHPINGGGSLKNPDLASARIKKENDRSLVNNTRWRSKTDAPAEEINGGNLTWPRQRSDAEKLKTGMKIKYPTPVLPSCSDSLRLNDFPDSTKSFFRNGSTESNVRSWKPTKLSVVLGENQARPSGSRLCWCKESIKCICVDDSLTSLPSAYLKSSVPTLNYVSLQKLERRIEESCRRLEMAAERDKVRESISLGETMNTERLRNKVGLCCKAGVEEDKFQAAEMKSRELIKRRNPEKCTGNCTCGTSRTDPCKYLRSKGCRSSFELDSFGPGNKHCHQLCMFCRKKDAEMYYSALCLNSKCSSDLCRLNYYGFCPCSTVKLNNVTSSPRAYMQRLLAVRRRIVSQTERMLLDGKTLKARMKEGEQSFDFLS